MQFQAINATVDAIRVGLLLGDNDELADYGRYYLVRSAGGAATAVDADAFEALYSPVAYGDPASEPAPQSSPKKTSAKLEAPPKVKAAPKEKPAKPAAAAAADAPAGEATSVSAYVLELIKKAPRTSAELIELAKKKFPNATPGSVYAANNMHKNNALIENRDDPADGYRKWFARLI